jgi:hypothetical protein
MSARGFVQAFFFVSLNYQLTFVSAKKKLEDKMENPGEDNNPEFLKVEDDHENVEYDEEITKLNRRKEVLDLVLEKLIEVIREP